MFLDWCSKLGLLEHDPSSNILGEFSLPVRKILVQQVVTFLLEGNNAVRTLVSPAHVTWAMETVGQGFGLPIDEEDSIMKVITLYRIWCLEGKGKRPAPIEENPQHFIQRMLMHYSMLFQPRESSKDLVEKHAVLCSKVLDIFLSIGRQLVDFLSVESWEIFLKLLISLSDNILRAELDKDQEPLQRKLVSQILKVVFELWLLSRTKNPELWAALKQRVQGWTHHMSLILTWKVTCFALTKRSTAILYGPSEGADCVSMKIDDSVQNLNLEDEYVFYAWHKMLYIIGNPNQTIQHPAIFLAFMNGVEILVNQYLKLGLASGRNRESRMLPPSGNTILHIFGTWLFDAVHVDRAGFDEGTALALKILCNMIISKHNTNWQPFYIANFYSGMHQALLKEGRVLLAAITSATNLFSFELQGIRTLVPSFVYAIHKILSKRVKPFDNVMPAEHVRRSCLTILGTLLCLPNHFRQAQFTLPTAGLDVSTFYDLKPHYSVILTEGMSSETYAPNLEILLNLAFTWLCEAQEIAGDFSKQILPLMLRKLNNGEWPPEVCRALLRTLTNISRLYEKLEKNFEQANFVVLSLCKFITGALNAALAGDRNKEDLICASLQTIADWLMVNSEGHWILHYKETRKELLKSIVMCLMGITPSPVEIEDPKNKDKDKGKDKKKHEKDKKTSSAVGEKAVPLVLDRVRDAAHATLLTLLNHSGNFPTACGAHSTSTMVTEEQLLLENLQKASEFGLELEPNESKQFMRYFITDDRVIICVIDRPYQVDGPSVTIVVRDKTGKYAWDAHLNYLSLKDRHNMPVIDQNGYNVPVSIEPYNSSVTPIPFDDVKHVYEFLQSKDTRDAIVNVRQQVEHEQQYLASQQHKLNHDISIAIPQGSNPYVGDCKLQQSRLLLSHLGYLSLHNRGRLFPCNLTPAFYNSLKMLDGVPERECIKLSVVYIRKGQTSEDEYFGNLGGTVDYQEFINSLGWGVTLNKHRGFKGGLDSKRAGSVAPYWSNYDTEIIFQVATLMPNTDSHPDHAHKKRIIFGTQVYAVIVWVEDLLQFQPNSIWSKARSSCVIIAVNPLQCGLYQVRLFSKGESSCIGPVVDGSVLSKDILGTMVRETAVCIHAKERLAQEGNIGQLQVRQQVIEDIFSKYKKETSLEQFYTSLFTALPEDQLGPRDGAARAGSQEVSSPRKRLKGSNISSPAVGSGSGSGSGGPSLSSSASSIPVMGSSSGSIPLNSSTGSGSGEDAPTDMAPTPPGAPRRPLPQRANTSGFGAIKPSQGAESKGGWLTMGSRPSRPSADADPSARIGGQHRRTSSDALDADGDDKKKHRKKSKDKDKKDKD